MEVSVDVAIVGAGPAGSTLAALLAGRGVTVALIDRDTFPRDKVCGEFLSYDALPVLQSLGVIEALDRHGAPRIERCRIVGRRRSYEFSMPQTSRGASRCLLDDLLYRTAIEKGAQAWDGWTAESIDATGVTVSRAGDRRTIVARLVAGAWGRWGRFDTQLQRAFVRDRSHRSFGFKRHYRAKAPRAAASGTIELFSFDSGYLGVNDVEGGVTNICGLVHASRLSGHRGRWESFVDSIRSEEPRLEELYAAHDPAQETFLTSEPVIFRARSAVERGVFTIGDASGVVDPLTGNGMAMAIQSALIAAPLLLEAISAAADRQAIERAYAARHAAMFASRIRWSRAIAALLSRPALLDRALAAGRGNGPGRFLVRRTRGDADRVARLTDAWFRRP